jgi:hypothetical protein
VVDQPPILDRESGGGGGYGVLPLHPSPQLAFSLSASQPFTGPVLAVGPLRPSPDLIGNVERAGEAVGPRTIGRDHPQAADALRALEAQFEVADRDVEIGGANVALHPLEADPRLLYRRGADHHGGALGSDEVMQADRRGQRGFPATSWQNRDDLAGLREVGAADPPHVRLEREARSARGTPRSPLGPALSPSGVVLARSSARSRISARFRRFQAAIRRPREADSAC